MAAMSRAAYIILAGVIRTTTMDRDSRANLMIELIGRLKEDNRNFDSGRFSQAVETGKGCDWLDRETYDGKPITPESVQAERDRLASKGGGAASPPTTRHPITVGLSCVGPRPQPKCNLVYNLSLSEGPNPKAQNKKSPAG